MKILKPIWILLGLTSVGIVLPVLPTTPFFLLAAFCFAKGSKRLDTWFKGTKLYKNHLESFVQNRSMTLKTKFAILVPASLMLIAAFLGMSRKNSIGTIIGRTCIAVMFLIKYVYFFTRIKTIPKEETTNMEKNNCEVNSQTIEDRSNGKSCISFGDYKKDA